MTGDKGTARYGVRWAVSRRRLSSPGSGPDDRNPSPKDHAARVLLTAEREAFAAFLEDLMPSSLTAGRSRLRCGPVPVTSHPRSAALVPTGRRT
jgi:hypothetical protein